MKTWKRMVIGLLIILGASLLMGCKNSSENSASDETSGEQAIVIVDPEDWTVVNEITDAEDIASYCEITSDQSGWQLVGGLPANARRLYILTTYEKKMDVSVFGNSGKVWLVSCQETLYRAGDTYYLREGTVWDGRTGITMDMNLYYQLPDDVGDYYMSLTEEKNDIVAMEELFASWGVDDYVERAEENFDNYVEKTEKDFDNYVDRIDDRLEDFDEYLEQETFSWIENNIDRHWDMLLEDRIDRRIDAFMEGTEGMIEIGVGILIRMILGIMLVPLIILYILGAIGLYRMAKKMEYNNPWLAWIPIGNLYLMFILPKGAFRVLAVNKVIERRENAFWIFHAAAMARMVLRAILAFPGGRLFYLFDDVVDIAWLVFLIFFLYPLYRDLFQLFEKESRAKTFAVWSMILPILLPIFLLIAASKEPKKSDRTPLIPATEEAGAGSPA